MRQTYNNYWQKPKYTVRLCKLPASNATRSWRKLKFRGIDWIFCITFWWLFSVYHPLESLKFVFMQFTDKNYNCNSFTKTLIYLLFCFIAIIFMVNIEYHSELKCTPLLTNEDIVAVVSYYSKKFSYCEKIKQCHQSTTCSLYFIKSPKKNYLLSRKHWKTFVLQTRCIRCCQTCL